MATARKTKRDGYIQFEKDFPEGRGCIAELTHTKKEADEYIKTYRDWKGIFKVVEVPVPVGKTAYAVYHIGE